MVPSDEPIGSFEVRCIGETPWKLRAQGGGDVGGDIIAILAEHRVHDRGFRRHGCVGFQGLLQGRPIFLVTLIVCRVWKMQSRCPKGPWLDELHSASVSFPAVDFHRTVGANPHDAGISDPRPAIDE